MRNFEEEMEGRGKLDLKLLSFSHMVLLKQETETLVLM
jgi:hypothetical protein